jgi:hypothetical protein
VKLRLTEIEEAQNGSIFQPATSDYPLGGEEHQTKTILQWSQSHLSHGRGTTVFAMGSFISKTEKRANHPGHTLGDQENQRHLKSSSRLSNMDLANW